MVKLLSPASLAGLFPLGHVVWATLHKVGQKQLKPAELEQGARHAVVLEIRGTVDGQAFIQSINSVLAVGYEQQKSSSVNPQVVELVALMLSKLNRATQKRILEDVPREFVENDRQLPHVNSRLVDQTDRMLTRLRRSKTVTARGAIRCEYSL